jgi:hypothetical protein
MSKQTHNLYTQSFQYDFAIDGGTVGTIATGSGCQSTGIQLPKFSLIVIGTLLVQTALTSVANNATLTLCNKNNSLFTIKNLGGAPLAVGGYDASNSGGPRVPTSATDLEILLAIGTEPLLTGKFILLLSYYSPINSLT